MYTVLFGSGQACHDIGCVQHVQDDNDHAVRGLDPIDDGSRSKFCKRDPVGTGSQLDAAIGTQSQETMAGNAIVDQGYQHGGFHGRSVGERNGARWPQEWPQGWQWSVNHVECIAGQTHRQLGQVFAKLKHGQKRIDKRLCNAFGLDRFTDKDTLLQQPGISIGTIECMMFGLMGSTCRQASQFLVGAHRNVEWKRVRQVQKLTLVRMIFGHVAKKYQWVAFANTHIHGES